MKIFVLILLIKIFFLHVYRSEILEKQCIKIGNSPQSQQLRKSLSINLTSFLQ